MNIINHAYNYLEALAWGGAVTWQTFDDTGKRRPGLARVIHGMLRDHVGELTALNDAGAGVFVTVNETDQRGRKAENVTRIRALFTDDDGGGLTNWPVEPNFLVHSVGGPHTYWLIHGSEGLEHFSEAQKLLANHMKTDPKVHDIPRVMRCPGFYHQKGERAAVTFESVNPGKRYSIAQVVGGLERLPQPKRRAYTPPAGPVDGNAPWWRRLNRPICEGNRNGELFRLACAMRAKGMGEAEMYSAVSELNQRLCAEPLDDSEVASIARNAGRY